MLVDSHVHVASADRQTYPLKPSKLNSSAWFTRDDVGIADLLGWMDGEAVARAMVVQGVGAYGHDCAYALASVQAHADRLRLVGSVDMDGPDPAAALAMLAKAAGDVLAGVRVFGVYGHAPAWLTDSRADEVWAEAARLGITIVATLFPTALPDLARVAARHPHMPVALEHIGFVDLAGGAPFAHAAPLFDLATLPALRLKVSTHSLEDAEAVGDPAALIDRLAATFGAERLIWGSDHPQSQARSYAEKLALARHAARHLSTAERDLFLGGAALKLWWPQGDSHG